MNLEIEIEEVLLIVPSAKKKRLFNFIISSNNITSSCSHQVSL